MAVEAVICELLSAKIPCFCENLESETRDLGHIHAIRVIFPPVTRAPTGHRAAKEQGIRKALTGISQAGISDQMLVIHGFIFCSIEAKRWSTRQSAHDQRLASIKEEQSMVSVFDMFSPIHLAYLQRCAEGGLDVVPADLDSIERLDPAVAHDPLFIEYRRRAAAGLLRRRPGRKPLSTARRLRLWAARFAIEDETACIWELRRAGMARRTRSDLPPCIQAAELVSRQFGFNVTPEALHNRLSRGGFR